VKAGITAQSSPTVRASAAEASAAAINGVVPGEQRESFAVASFP